MSRIEKIKMIISIPWLIFSSILILPSQALLRKIKGKPISVSGLFLSQEELQLLEEASRNNIPILINNQKITLQKFDCESKHVHPSCEICPDELYLNDNSGRPCLSGSRKQGQALWKFYAIKPIALGLLGHINTDLKSLCIDDRILGKATE